MTVGRAAVAVAVAMARIFLGSLLFALWAAHIWQAWATIQNLPFRVIAVIALFTGMVVSLVSLFVAIAWLARPRGARIRQ